mgnify:CR=1 FL=1
MIQTGKLIETPQFKTAPQPVADKVLFSADSTSKYSYVFTVQANELAVIVGYNLADGDSLHLDHVGGEGSGQFFTPVIDRAYPVAISSHDSSVRIRFPGRYRLRFEGSAPIGSFYAEITR